MAENSEISWTDHTFNPWIGCTKVGPGCDNCYAEARLDKRFHRVKWGTGQERIRTNTWGDPRAWNGRHDKFFAEHGRRQRVFCASLADVFDNAVDPEWRNDLFTLILATPNLDWLLLTKRIGNVRSMVSDALWARMTNVWLGATIVNQEEADRDIPKLLAIPARVRFLSMEPLLGPVDLRMVAVPADQDQLRRPWDFEGSKFNALQEHDEDRFHQPPAALDWVIVGGESGPGARPMHPDWARSLRDQCAAAGVPLHFKQHGEYLLDESETAKCEAAPPGHLAHLFEARGIFRKVGKKAAGRLLDGVTHDAFPEVR